MQGCVLSIVAIDALMLKQQVISPTVLTKYSLYSVEENTKIRNVTKDRNFGAKITYVSNISN